MRFVQNQIISRARKGSRKCLILYKTRVSSLTGSGLFVLMSQWGNNNELENIEGPQPG